MQSAAGDYVLDKEQYSEMRRHPPDTASAASFTPEQLALRRGACKSFFFASIQKSGMPSALLPMFDARPVWEFYRFMGFPARILGLAQDSRLYAVAVVGSREAAAAVHAKGGATAADLSLVEDGQWTLDERIFLARCPSPGLMLDPLGVCSVKTDETVLQVFDAEEPPPKRASS